MDFCNFEMDVWVECRIIAFLGAIASFMALALTDTRKAYIKEGLDSLNLMVALLGSLIPLVWNRLLMLNSQTR